MRIAVVHRDRCHPVKCGTECILYCPRVRTGDETVIIGETGKAVVSEELCVGCGICIKKCPFEAIDIVSLPKKFKPLLPSLELMADLCQELRRRRIGRGAIDFDLPEPEVILNLQGETEDIVRAERNLAHQIIEEFMIAANEAVAHFMEEKGVPFIYRIHETEKRSD